MKAPYFHVLSSELNVPQYGFPNPENYGYGIYPDISFPVVNNRDLHYSLQQQMLPIEHYVGSHIPETSPSRIRGTLQHVKPVITEEVLITPRPQTIFLSQSPVASKLGNYNLNYHNMPYPPIPMNIMRQHFPLHIDNAVYEGRHETSNIDYFQNNYFDDPAEFYLPR